MQADRYGKYLRSCAALAQELKVSERWIRQNVSFLDWAASQDGHGTATAETVKQPREVLMKIEP